MNPVLLILIIVALVILWFVCSPLYKPIGNLFYRLGKYSYDIMTEEEAKTTNENKNNKGED